MNAIAPQDVRGTNVNILMTPVRTSNVKMKGLVSLIIQSVTVFITAPMPAACAVLGLVDRTVKLILDSTTPSVSRTPA